MTTNPFIKDRKSAEPKAAGPFEAKRDRVVGEVSVSEREESMTGSVMPKGPWDGLVDGAMARRFEDRFIGSFRQSFSELGQLPGPEEGVEYDRRPDREQVREWDDREEVKRHLLRTAATARADAMPRNRGVQHTLLVKPFLSAMVPKVSVVAACWSPLEALSKGAVKDGAKTASLEVVEELLDRLLVHERPNLFHFIGICSTTGWEEGVNDPLPMGRNYMVTMVAPKPPGWVVDSPRQMPPALLLAFDPEDVDTKRQRVVQMIRAHPSLQSPGGLLLLEELAELAVVPYVLAGEAAWELARESGEFEVREVSGSRIIQRRAFRS